jgi:soluble lytic murein transglycosylase-like protein
VRATQLVLFILLILATTPPAVAGQSEQRPRLAVTEAQGQKSGVFLRQMPGLRQAFAMVRLDLGVFFGDHARVERMLGSPSEREAALEELPPARRAQEAAMYARAVARWAEFEHLVGAVAGRPAQHEPLAYRDVWAAFVADGPFVIPADTEALVRDRIVLFMAMSGHVSNLIADVVRGRLTIQVVEQAAKLRLVGRTEVEVARYLEAHVGARAAVPAPPAIRVDQAMRERFDPVVVRHARLHGVDPDLVRAVITHESAWNAAARSHKGAIGLMQLMPETARLLGVDPVVPEQNIAGGIHYLADLRALFDGNLDALIVAYVAGPTYARRWLRGTTVLDAEVRAYLDNVKASYWRRSAWRKD